MSKMNYIDSAIAWVEKKSTSTIKSRAEGYDSPKAILNKGTGEEILPDFSFENSFGSKSYTDIALKSDTPQKLVTRWKLLSMLASMKNGKLHLLAPKGHKLYTKSLVDKYKIGAIIHSI